MDDKFLKDVVISTIAELEFEDDDFEEIIEKSKSSKIEEPIKIEEPKPEEKVENKKEKTFEEITEIDKDELSIESIINSLTEFQIDSENIKIDEEPSEKVSVPSKEYVFEKPKDLEKFSNYNSDEKIFLENLKERIDTLFEGLKSEETTQVEKKLDLTLQYLQYISIIAEERLSEI
jgi:hypothetical protein